MSTQDLARRRWPDALWVDGDGRFAVAAHCGVGTTITLHRGSERAAMAKMNVDRTGCGSRCQRDHEIVELTP